MKVFVFIILNHNICCFGERNLIPLAIHQIIEQHFVKNSIPFDFVFNSKDSNLLEETLKLVKDLKAMRVVKAFDNDTNEFNLDHSAVFIFDELKSYQKFELRTNAVKNGPKEINLLIFCVDASEKLIKASLLQDKLQIRTFLVVENKKIDLWSTTLFTTEMCHRQQLISVNKFSKETLSWTTDIFSMSTVNDFHGCSFVVGIASSNRPSSDCYLDVCTGYHIALLNELKKVLNLNIEFNVFVANFTKFSRRGNGNLKNHFVVLTVPINFDSFFNYDLTSPILTADYVIAVPPGQRYSSIEKLFLPFDVKTWILFLVLFAVAFGTTFFIGIVRSTSLKSFIAGVNVQPLALNVFGAYMGLAQQSLPARNVARFLLMNLIIFSLVMRTAYQGKYFEFLTTNPQKKIVQSIDELIEKDFKVYYMSGGDDFYKNILQTDRTERLSFLQTLVQLYNVFSFRLNAVEVSSPVMQHEIFPLIQDPMFHGSIVDDRFHLLYDERRLYSEIEWNFLDETIASFNMAITFARLSYLYPIFNKKIIQLDAGGFINYWISSTDWMNYNVKKIAAALKKPDYSGKRVLTMTELTVGFAIWLLMILMSLMSFVGELLIFWTSTILRKIFFEFVIRQLIKSHKEAFI